MMDHKYDFQFRVGPHEDESTGSAGDAKEGGATNWVIETHRSGKIITSCSATCIVPINEATAFVEALEIL